MATFNKFNCLVENIAEGVHDFSGDTLTVALCTVAPVATNSVLADLTQISYTNCSSRVLTVSSSSQTSGTYKLIVDDLRLTASGGAIAAFQYIVIYNDTPTSPADPLLGWYDYGSSLTLANDGDYLDIDLSAVNGLLQMV